MEFRHSQCDVAGASLHVVEAGDPAGPPVLFLHGWPQSWRTWRDLMKLGAPAARMIAIDLPGIGRSTGPATTGAKGEIAAVVHDLIATMGLADVTLVGHDVGGVVAYSYVRSYADVSRVVILNTAIPGLDPWNSVVTNPFVWHIAFHGTPELPELLVQGHQRRYFDYFYDLLAPRPGAITAEARQEYADAYASDAALTAGFNWYRAFGKDAHHHQAMADQPIAAPLLYLHGDHEFGDVDAAVAGLRAVNVERLEFAVLANAGHFAQEDAPGAVWEQVARFAGLS